MYLRISTNFQIDWITQRCCVAIARFRQNGERNHKPAIFSHRTYTMISCTHLRQIGTLEFLACLEKVGHEVFDLLLELPCMLQLGIARWGAEMEYDHPFFFQASPFQRKKNTMLSVYEGHLHSK
ncbi:hypothetical protein DM01DRAFT_1134347 [Hesseltinella vesiculosa]|uniref:Uncharacterized protein n=1 Tax=Hesseltinella vesiculosa TaxID=101127 RepID=A0A1X2G8S2_9FUNG|nr:hypothetical protein DM01DRAFT_1134347 [Hesseltinella vesiculosa]